MKPPPFAYLAPTSVASAAEALAEPGAMVLAGGQSLLLELAYRQHRPRLLVDINRIHGLDSLEEGPDGLRIGALVRHRQLEDGGAGSPVRRLLARIAPYVAHPPIRNRGTFCGSIAWAHPAAEWNAVAAAFDGEVHVLSSSGSRTIGWSDYYCGDQQTSRRPDELVTAVTLAPVPAGTGTGFAEHRRTHASFADVAVLAAVTAADGAVRRARLAAVGVADRPLRLRHVEQAMVGVETAEAAGWVRRTLLRTDEVPGDDYHRAAAAELAGRAVEEALAR